MANNERTKTTPAASPSSGELCACGHKETEHIRLCDAVASGEPESVGCVECPCERFTAAGTGDPRDGGDDWGDRSGG